MWFRIFCTFGIFHKILAKTPLKPEIVCLKRNAASLNYINTTFFSMGHRKLHHEHLTDFCLGLADLDTKWTAHSECILLNSTPTTLIQATKKLHELLNSSTGLPIFLVYVRHSKKSCPPMLKILQWPPLPLPPLWCSHTRLSIPLHYICGPISIINSLIYLVAYLPFLQYN